MRKKPTEIDHNRTAYRQYIQKIAIGTKKFSIISTISSIGVILLIAVLSGIFFNTWIASITFCACKIIVYICIVLMRKREVRRAAFHSYNVLSFVQGMFLGCILIIYTYQFYVLILIGIVEIVVVVIISYRVIAKRIAMGFYEAHMNMATYTPDSHGTVGAKLFAYACAAILGIYATSILVFLATAALVGLMLSSLAMFYQAYRSLNQ